MVYVVFNFYYLTIAWLLEFYDFRCSEQHFFHMEFRPKLNCSADAAHYAI